VIKYLGAMVAVLVSLMTLEPPARSEPVTKAPPLTRCIVHVLSNDPTPSLNLRTLPNGTILAELQFGDIVDVFDSMGQWVFVAGGQGDKYVFGWVYGSYLADCHDYPLR